MPYVTPFFVGKQNSHPDVLVQESMTLTGAGPGIAESGNGTVLYENYVLQQKESESNLKISKEWYIENAGVT